MPKLKSQLHVHTKEDRRDNIRHTEKQTIDRAAKLGYDVLAISCHDVVIFNDNLFKYAEEKRILLIPAIEKTIERKHVLILNANVEAQNINTFNDLKLYKKRRPECLIIAPHPYYPESVSLKKKLEENIDIFDAIEYSWAHTKHINGYNKKAVKMAEKFNLPVVGTSDCHQLRNFDQTYSIIEAEKNIKSIFKAIKNNNISLVSHNSSLFRILSSYIVIVIKSLIKKMTLK